MLQVQRLTPQNEQQPQGLKSEFDNPVGRCGGLTRHGPHRFTCLNISVHRDTWSIGRGTLRRCGLAEAGVALWEEVCQCWGGL